MTCRGCRGHLRARTARRRLRSTRSTAPPVRDDPCRRAAASPRSPPSRIVPARRCRLTGWAKSWLASRVGMAAIYHFLCPAVGLSYGVGMPDELALLDATAQADLVRGGEVTPSVLVDAAIARIEAVNPKLNAVIIPLFD